MYRIWLLIIVTASPSTLFCAKKKKKSCRAHRLHQKLCNAPINNDERAKKIYDGFQNFLRSPANTYPTQLLIQWKNNFQTKQQELAKSQQAARLELTKLTTTAFESSTTYYAYSLIALLCWFGDFCVCCFLLHFGQVKKKKNVLLIKK